MAAFSQTAQSHPGRSTLSGVNRPYNQSIPYSNQPTPQSTSSNQLIQPQSQSSYSNQQSTSANQLIQPPQSSYSNRQSTSANQLIQPQTQSSYSNRQSTSANQLIQPQTQSSYSNRQSTSAIQSIQSTQQQPSRSLHPPALPPYLDQSAHQSSSQGLTPLMSQGYSNELLNSMFTRKRSRHSSHRDKKRDKAWTHTFVCLHDVKCNEVPSVVDKTNLSISGLGEKRFPLLVTNDPADLDDTLFSEYPSLENAGGYDLLVKAKGSNELILIECPPGGYTTQYIRNVVGGAKVYVRPLKRSIPFNRQNAKVYTSCIVLFHM